MAGIDIGKYRQSVTSQKKDRAWTSFLNLLQRDIQLPVNSFGDKKKERFYSELGLLITAGMDIRLCLDLLLHEQQNKKDSVLIGQIRNEVLAGKPLSEAVYATGKFSLFEFHSIRIGETTGQTQQIFTELQNFYKGRIKLKRQLVSSLTYPALVLVVALGAMFFMLHFVVPMFEDIFKQFKGELPLLTRWIISVSKHFSSWFGYGVVILVTLVVTGYWQRNQLYFRKITSAILLRLPIVGKMIHQVYLARFCQGMNLLLRARVHLPEALQLVRDMVRFYPIETSLKQIREQVVLGSSLHKGLSDYRIYPSRLTAMIKVGEEVNQLDLIFERLSQQYSDEVDHKTSLLGTLLEPALIVFIGILVGVILVAMYLPMFELSTSF